MLLAGCGTSRAKTGQGRQQGPGGRSQVSVSSPPRWRWLGVRTAFPSVGEKGWEKNLRGADTSSTRSRGPGLPAGLQAGTQSEREGATPSGGRGARGAELALPLSLSLPPSLNCPQAGPALPLALQGSAHSSAHLCASLRTSPHPPRISPHPPAPPRPAPPAAAAARIETEKITTIKKAFVKMRWRFVS